MAFSMSGVDDGWSYNRFDIYEKRNKKEDCPKCEGECECEEPVKEGLDPVGKEDADVNNDGKKDSSDKYLLNRRKAIGKAMKKEETEETESYTAQYMEGYKKFPHAKVQDKAAMKPDTARGESQARKMDTVRKATEMHPKPVEKMVKGQEMSNKKSGLERKFNAPSADDAGDKKRKNAAYKLENQRRQDLNKRYGPKKEELEKTGLFTDAELDKIIEEMFYENGIFPTEEEN